MSKLRVLVVEDSLTVRKRLVQVLDGDPGLTVVGEAADGQRATEMCQKLRPDVITMDMMLPVMTGLAATEYIMAYSPTPILIVSSSTNRGELFRTGDALAAGALYVIEKSPVGLTAAVWERQLIDTVKLVARVKVITHPRARLAQSRLRVIHRREEMTTEKFQAALLRARDRIVVIAKRAPPRSEAQNLAERFRQHGAAYFTFITTPGIAPTNNLAEQAIRFVVIDRRISQGTRGETGRRWCERFWTAIATCTQQAQSVYQFLLSALQAHLAGTPAPSLLPAYAHSP